MLDNAKALLNRADSYFEKGNPDKALACYYLVRRLTNDDMILQTIYPRIARTHSALKQYERAIDSYIEATRYTEPNDLSNIYVEIGRLYQSSGNNREAVRYYRDALNISPPPDFIGDVLYWLGESLYKVPEIDQNDESLKILEQAKTSERNLVLTWEIHNTKGHALTQKQRHNEALNEFESALNEPLDFIDIPGNIYNNKGGCLEALGSREPAISCYREAIRAPRRQFDTLGFAYIRIGVLLKDSNPRLARRELERAKGFFETARNSKEIPEWFADEHLSTIDRLIDDINRMIGVPEMQPKLPPIQFFGPVGVGFNMGAISEVNQTIGQLAEAGPQEQEAAKAIKELVESIGNSTNLDDSQKNGLVEAIEQIGREVQKSPESRDKSKRFTLEGVKSTLEKVVDVAEVAAKAVNILITFF